MLGKGNTAEVFEYEHGKVCKLFFEGYSRQYVEHEYQNTNLLYEHLCKKEILIFLLTEFPKADKINPISHIEKYEDGEE